ncbi:response regulator [Treponema sp. R6D11]
MNNRERLLAISELNLAGKIEQMEEGKLDNYVQLLNSFSDNLPTHEKKIKEALVLRDYEALTKHLTAVRSILEKIYADEMAQDCTRQINSFGTLKPEKIEAYMRYFLTNLSMLSTDIQKAQQQTYAPAAQEDSPDEKNKIIDMDILFSIADLNLDRKIEQMEDEEFKNYVKLLDTFTENFPAQEEKIKAALKAKNNEALAGQLSEVKNILEKIYADEMADECSKQIELIGKTKPEKIEAYMRYFLSSLSMLSLDIQMSLHKIDKSSALHTKGSSDEGSKTDKRILAVDDTAFFLVILKKKLQNTRYHVNCVTSGRDALKFLEKHKTDIFLLDIEMPGMNGFELAAKIREKGHKEPIIFLTGNARKEYFAMAMKAGATDFIIKPINRDVLLSKIRKYI